MNFGFTMVELLVVIAIIGVLAGLLLPALGRAKGQAQWIQCLNNNKQLITAWIMYADDNNGFIPPNVDGVDGRGVWTNWVAGTMSSATDRTNAALLVDRRESLIADYVQNPQIFKCPGDRSVNVRSMALNHRMNPVRYLGVPVFTAGKHLDYPIFTRTSDIQRPSDIFVTLDERSDSINDSYFVVDASNTDQRIMKAIRFTLLLFIVAAMFIPAASAAEPLRYSVSWLGNSFGGASNKWVQNFFIHTKVQPDGTVNTWSHWDEGGKKFGVYKDGDVIGNTNVNPNSLETRDTTGAVRLGKRPRQLLEKEEAGCRRSFCLLTAHANG